MIDVEYDITTLEKLCDESGVLVDNVPFPMIITDADYRLMKANSMFHELSGMKDDLYSFNFKKWKDDYLEPISSPEIDNKRHTVRQEYKRKNSSDKFSTYMLFTQEVYDEQDKLAGYIVIFRETTDQRDYEKNLFMLANTDSLTGLYNRRFLYEYLKNHANNLWSFIYLDLDGFKYINDNYGHSRGDKVLIDTANLISRIFSEYKVVRLGGDEFAVLVDEELDDDFLNIKVADLCKDVEKIFSDDTMTLTISVGVARRRGTEINIDELIREGDRKMYEMKQHHHDKALKNKKKTTSLIRSREYLLDIVRQAFIKSEDLPVTDIPEDNDYLKEVCEALRISRLLLKYYENTEEEHRGNGNEVVLYDSMGKKENEELDISRRSERRNVTRGYNIAYYIAWQKKDEPDWNDDETDAIDLLLRILYVMNGRNRVMRLAEKLTFYDHDLGIHNIKYFFGFLGRLIQERKAGDYVAMCFNLKRFSVVNQQLGRMTGTVVMKNYARAIEDILTKDELICRVGGDNFTVLVKKEKADRVLDILKGVPIVYNERTNEKIFVSAAVGIFIIPENCPLKSPSEIMDRISSAMYIAKRNGTSDVVFFDDHMLDDKRREIMVSGAFRDALHKEEFMVYYQPKISVDDNTLSGAEALCRWIHDKRLIPPAEFIPFLEKSQDVCDLDFYMLEHVCRDIRRWLDMGKRVVRVSVNFSRRHLTDISLLEHILEVIDRNNVPHEYIEIELTETTTDVEFRDLKRVVKGLQENGIMTAVDDFGIGYSSLNLIRDIPWNVLKIDKSFLPLPGDALENEKKLMFKYVVAMAQSIGLQCIVEGVETKEQLSILKENSCELAQGYYFDKPLPVDEFEKKLDNYIYR